MATNEVRRATMRPESSVYTRPVGVSSKTVCAYWIAGRCTKKFCRFLHTSAPSTLANPHISNLKAIQKGNAYNATQKSNVVQKSPEKVCKFWVVANCVEGDRCPYLHTWFRGAGFSMLAKLQGHKKAVTGIALPETSDKLYSAGTDGTVRVWDCRTGQCGSVINLGGEAGSLVSEGPWLFVGVPNVVKAWNIRTNAEFNLNGPVGQVHAMVVANEMLFAGAQDGVILVWKGCSESNPFQLAGTLKGHTQAVVCLTVGRSRLYSGSVDQTIRVWDLDSLQCIVTLNAHSDVVMSLICWDQFLLSCSLDCTIKVWVATGGGNLEVTYTHNEEHGVLALSGMPDAEAKPVLFCSCNDTSVRLYELPSFTDRGRLFGKREVRALQIGPRGLFFTGDATGLLSVWKWLDPALKELSS
ncbi:PREDICTED: zinc finger [Prunus dulcis]|uniref:PREDICTED: zinc finger n=1 Tax=Prunus dulcis TaxID=3755 RepID=A0A5E4G3Y9_PRUDU|nr:zinc finger CCCH domain-containing protein 48-like [Prunus dulcis]VVA34373.1 PREDICTED: zinc finger [Prunus dulcis]